MYIQYIIHKSYAYKIQNAFNLTRDWWKKKNQFSTNLSFRTMRWSAYTQNIITARCLIQYVQRQHFILEQFLRDARLLGKPFADGFFKIFIFSRNTVFLRIYYKRHAQETPCWFSQNAIGRVPRAQNIHKHTVMYMYITAAVYVKTLIAFAFSPRRKRVQRFRAILSLGGGGSERKRILFRCQRRRSSRWATADLTRKSYTNRKMSRAFWESGRTYTRRSMIAKRRKKITYCTVHDSVGAAFTRPPSSYSSLHLHTYYNTRMYV